MKLAGWMMMAAAGVALVGLAGCDENRRVAYDPEVDGVLPHPEVSADASILENQKKLYEAFLASGGGAPKAAPAAAPAPAPAPAAAPGEGAPATPAAPATPSPEAPATPAPEPATPAPAPATPAPEPAAPAPPPPPRE